MIYGTAFYYYLMLLRFFPPQNFLIHVEIKGLILSLVPYILHFIFKYAACPLAIVLLRTLVKRLVSSPYRELNWEMNVVGQIVYDKATPEILFSIFVFLSLP